MVRYAKEAENPAKSCKARGFHLRTHFKTSREVAQAIKGMHIRKATKYLKDVVAQKQIIPMRRFMGGVGRHAQAKAFNTAGSLGAWPKKSATIFLDLLKNAESNAEVKGLEVDSLVIEFIQVNRATQMRRRTYRAHGRINPFMCSPCHVEMILTETESIVTKEAEDAPKKASKKKEARARARLGPME